jgi:cell division septation protein DedD
VPTPSPTASPTPTKVAKPAATAGSYGIQLGAFKSSADAANTRWAHLDKAYPKLLTGLSPTVAPKKSPSGTLYRLQVAGLTEKHARAICKSLKAKSEACVLIHPTHH